MAIRIIPRDTPEAVAERAAVAAGRLPARYAEPWQSPFLDRVAAALHPGVRVLDVGSGARPAVRPEDRPDDCTYIGLDVSGHELSRAGRYAYDDVLVGDICDPLPPSAGQFDLVLSWQVLEHVRSMEAALATQHAALATGGRMLAMVSGAWSCYALASRVMPYRVSTSLQARLLGIQPESKFPTRYDRCSDRALRNLLAQGGWSFWELVPRYKAGGYLRFSHPLQHAYLVFENWAERGPRRNLATHYIIDAVA